MRATGGVGFRAIFACNEPMALTSRPCGLSAFGQFGVRQSGRTNLACPTLLDETCLVCRYATSHKVNLHCAVAGCCPPCILRCLSVPTRGNSKGPAALPARSPTPVHGHTLWQSQRAVGRCLGLIAVQEQLQRAGSRPPAAAAQGGQGRVLVAHRVAAASRDVRAHPGARGGC